MNNASLDVNAWAQSRVRPEEIARHLGPDGADFVDDAAIAGALRQAQSPDAGRLGELLDRSLSLNPLGLAETAELMLVSDPAGVERMEAAAQALTRQAFGRRVNAFATLFLGNDCVNQCRYCAARGDCGDLRRRVLGEAEIKAEVELLVGQLGHRQLVAAYGEHPSMDAAYIADSVAAIYGVQAAVNGAWRGVQRVQVQAPPMAVADLRRVAAAGPSGYQCFQETYQRQRYAEEHLAGPKADYRWRLYAQHRAAEAGFKDLGLGVLLGLSDWRFEVLASLLHAQDLERRFGLRPSTLSLPRLADGADLAAPRPVSDAEYLRAICVLRLSQPTLGLVVTACEGADLRRSAFRLGVTQADACASLGVGAFHDGGLVRTEHQKFSQGDPRCLQDLALDLAEAGVLTSFCAPGPDAALNKLNAALSFKEWMDDFGGPQLRAPGARLLERERAEIEETLPQLYPRFRDGLERAGRGEREVAV